MQKLILFVLLVGTFSCTFDAPTSTAPTPDNFSYASFTQDQVYDRLAVFPILGKQDAQASEALITLEEAIENPRFRIVESQANMALETYDVQRWRQGNKVIAENKSDQLIFVMAGDVIGGGKQDRVIAEDAVLAAKSLNRIPVYCVEKNRWSYKQNEKNKNQYAFGGYFKVASPAVREKVAIQKDQNAVWASVGAITKKMNAETNTGTYTAVLNKESNQAQLDKYIEHFKSNLDTKDCVGFVAVSGNKILGADIFGSSKLFNKKIESLLYGYATEAMNAGETPKLSLETEKENWLSQKHLDAYLETLDYKFDKGVNIGNSTVFKYKDKVLHLADYLN